MSNAPTNRWNLAAVAFLVLALGVLGAWAAMGAHWVTVYSVAVETEVSDEFGDTFTTTVMEPGFRFGLLPDTGPDGALPWLLLLLAGAGFSFYRGRKARKTADETYASA